MKHAHESMAISHADDAALVDDNGDGVDVTTAVVSTGADGEEQSSSQLPQFGHVLQKLLSLSMKHAHESMAISHADDAALVDDNGDGVDVTTAVVSTGADGGSKRRHVTPGWLFVAWIARFQISQRPCISSAYMENWSPWQASAATQRARQSSMFLTVLFTK